MTNAAAVRVFFIIETPKNHGNPWNYIVSGADSDDCIRKLHEHLRENDPDTWTEDWRELKADIERFGDQTMFIVDNLTEIT